MALSTVGMPNPDALAALLEYIIEVCMMQEEREQVEVEIPGLEAEVMQ